MIQRIQSVFLLLAIVLIAALLTIGVPFSSRASESYAWFSPSIGLLAGISIAASGMALFQFRNRPAQVRTTLIAFVLADLLGVVQVVGYALGDDFVGMDVLGFIAVALPFLAAVLLLLARQAIARDIALVRSMDRLR